MLRTKKTSRKLLAAVSLVPLYGAAAHAANYTWDGSDSAMNTNWSNPLNWTADSGTPSATGDNVTLGPLGLTAVGMTSTVDVNSSIGSLQATFTSATLQHSMVINTGVTLTLSNAATSSGTIASQANASLFVSPGTTINTLGVLSITGAGALQINSGSVVVSGRPNNSTTQSAGAVLDLTGLSSFTYDRSANPGQGVIRVGGGDQLISGGPAGQDGAYWGKLILGDLTNISTNRIVIGAANGGSGAGGPLSTLALGKNNNINNAWSGTSAFAGAIYVGSDPKASKVGSGAIIHGIGLTGANAPVTTIGDADHRNLMHIGAGRVENNTGHFSYGVVDFTSASGMNESAALRVSDGTVNAWLSTLQIGKGPTNTETHVSATSAGAAGVGALWFDKGTIDATTVILGSSSATGNATPNVGILTVGLKGDESDAGLGSLIAGTITVGDQTHNVSSSGNTNIGVLNVGNGGSVTADKVFLSNNTVDTTPGVVGVLNIGSDTGGGTVVTNQVKAGGTATQVGTVTRVVNFNGGTLKAKAGVEAGDAAAFVQGLTAANVYARGGTIDTNGESVTINQALVAPAGNGISAINFTGGTGFRAAPVVVITGGGGTGATAVAKINTDGTINDIVITNPGTGYTSAPNIYLLANGRTGSGNLASWGAMAEPFGGTSVTATGVLSANTSGGITKTGTGTLTLGGLNTYTGGTTVNAGTLLLSGNGTSTGVLDVASTVTVKNTASFGGTGFAKGAVNVEDGGTLRPGIPGTANGIGTQSLGSLTMSSNAAMVADIDLTTNGSSDQLTIAGSITLGGTLYLNLLGDVQGEVDLSYKLIDNTGGNGIGGTFLIAALPEGVEYDLQNGDGNDYVIHFSAVPEPSSLGVLALAAGLGLRRRRRRA